MNTIAQYAEIMLDFRSEEGNCLEQLIKKYEKILLEIQDKYEDKVNIKSKLIGELKRSTLSFLLYKENMLLKSFPIYLSYSLNASSISATCLLFMVTTSPNTFDEIIALALYSATSNLS